MYFTHAELPLAVSHIYGLVFRCSPNGTSSEPSSHNDMDQHGRSTQNYCHPNIIFHCVDNKVYAAIDHDG